jgi:hypothetical protein
MTLDYKILSKSAFLEIVFNLSTMIRGFSFLLVTLCLSETDSRIFQLGVLTPHSGSRAFGFEVEATIAMAVEKVSFYIATYVINIYVENYIFHYVLMQLHNQQKGIKNIDISNSNSTILFPV